MVVLRSRPRRWAVEPLVAEGVEWSVPGMRWGVAKGWSFDSPWIEVIPDAVLDISVLSHYRSGVWGVWEGRFYLLALLSQGYRLLQPAPLEADWITGTLELWSRKRMPRSAVRYRALVGLDRGVVVWRDLVVRAPDAPHAVAVAVAAVADLQKRP